MPRPVPARIAADDLQTLRDRLRAPVGRGPAIALVAVHPALIDSPSLAALAIGLAGALGRLGAEGPPPDVVRPDDVDAISRLRAADRIVLVAGGGPAPLRPAIARLLIGATERRIGVHLVGAPGPGGADLRRAWGSDHGHPIRLDHREDLDRLARWLCDRAVGVALGGGGARAAAHFGVLDGLVAAGIPIDALTGASAGAAVGAMYANGRGGLQAVRHMRAHLDWLGVTGWRAARLPAMAVLRPARYAAFTARLVGEHDIEDLPLPFACVSTDVGAGALRVHDDGSLWRAVLASAALPGLIPPVRAEDGALLVDGGVVDNIPIAPLRQMGVGAVVAVDINPLRRWAPRARRWTRRLPDGMTQAMAGAVGQTFRGMTRATRRAAGEADVYIAPALPACGILSFGQMEAAYRVGQAAVPRAVRAAAGAPDEDAEPRGVGA